MVIITVNKNCKKNIFKYNPNENLHQRSVCKKNEYKWTVTILSSMHTGAVLLSSIQGLAINVDPVLYTWLTYQPQKRASRHIQQVCILGGEGIRRAGSFCCIYTSRAFLFHAFFCRFSLLLIVLWSDFDLFKMSYFAYGSFHFIVFLFTFLN